MEHTAKYFRAIRPARYTRYRQKTPDPSSSQTKQDVLPLRALYLINANTKIFGGGIWNLLNNHKTLFVVLTTSKEKYKLFNSFLKFINLLENDSLF